GNRDLDCSAHPVDVGGQLCDRDFVAEQRLVAGRDPHHAARVVGQLDGSGNLAFVALVAVADPDPERYAQAEFLGQAGDVGQLAVHRVGAGAVGVPAQQLQVLTDLLGAGVGPGLRVLPGTEGREGEAGDLLRPVRGTDGAVV